MALSTTKLSGIADYSPADMVLTARAGTTLAEIQAAARQHGQYLPLDCPFPARATIGGVTACNRQGLWRPLFGTPKDRILGMRLALADGTVVKGGGKVVKNVAGFDLCHLFTGSRGSLGLILETTYKTSPLPEQTSQIAFRAGSAARAAEAALTLHKERLQPLYAVVHTQGEAALLTIGLSGGAETVAWQTDRIEEILSKQGLERTEPSLSEDELRHRLDSPTAPVAGRIVTLPSEFPNLLERLADAGIEFVAQAPVGIVSVGLPAAEASSIELVRALAARGHINWTRVPPRMKEGLDVFGPLGDAAKLNCGVKRILDPAGVFSPGRFAGRL
jgi:FAD/FMN-containing dehydrogenase